MSLKDPKINFGWNLGISKFMKATFTCFKRSYYEFIPSLKKRERIWKNIDIQDYQIGSQSKLNNAIFASIVACSFIMQSKIWKR